MDILLGILIPFIGTTIGASFVFFMKKKVFFITLVSQIK